MPYTTTGTLAATPPFDFLKSLNFINGFGPMAGEQRIAERSLTRAVMLGAQPVAFTLTAQGSPDAPELAYTLFADQPIAPATQRAAEDRASFFLSLNDDLRPFYTLAEADDVFAPIVRALWGYHQVKFITPFENAAWAILTQRNTMAIARNLKARLIERYGATLEVEGRAYPVFPTAETIAAADPAELYDMLPSMRRAEYVQDVARAFAAADESWLRNAPAAEVEAWLRGINGIGRWSAGFILLRGLGRAELLPPDEKKLAASVAKHYNAGQPVPERKLRALAAHYGAYQGYWAHYMRLAG